MRKRYFSHLPREVRIATPRVLNSRLGIFWGGCRGWESNNATLFSVTAPHTVGKSAINVVEKIRQKVFSDRLQSLAREGPVLVARFMVLVSLFLRSFYGLSFVWRSPLNSFIIEF